jgi:hypothetical protein
VQTEEVANAAAFLLSPRSSGINAQGLVIDAGMGINYFDQALVSPQSEPIPIPETPRVYSEAIRSENEVPPENSGMIHK